jgi:hypothetical protein
MEGVSKNLIQSTLLDLSASLWLELVFKPHLSIESGVALLSSCSFFWKSEKIREWLREKEKQVFGSNIPKLFWNKLADYVELPIGSICFFCENYLVLYACTSSSFGWNYIFGVFSSKERLFLALKTLLNLDYEGTSNVNCKYGKSFLLLICLGDKNHIFVCLYLMQSRMTLNIF